MVPAAQSEGLLAGRVVRVIDGDTLDVMLDSGMIRVRLHGIDAPELNQPGGRESRQWLRQRLRENRLLLEPVSQDRYERMVARVHVQTAVINEEMVSAGQAWAYRNYLRRADRPLCGFEAQARAAGRGLWSAPMPHAPWEHRSTAGHGPFTDFSRQTARDCLAAIPRRR